MAPVRSKTQLYKLFTRSISDYPQSEFVAQTEVRDNSSDAGTSDSGSFSQSFWFEFRFDDLHAAIVGGEHGPTGLVA